MICPNCYRPMSRRDYGHACERCDYRAALQTTIAGHTEILTLRGEVIREEAPTVTLQDDKNQLTMF